MLQKDGESVPEAPGSILIFVENTSFLLLV
jgi:hypothetical protein